MQKKKLAEIEKAAKEILDRRGVDKVFVTEDCQVFLKQDHARDHAKGKSKIFVFPEPSETDEEGLTIDHYKVKVADLTDEVEELREEFNQSNVEKDSLKEDITRLENENQELQNIISEKEALIVKLQLQLEKKPNLKTTAKAAGK